MGISFAWSDDVARGLDELIGSGAPGPVVFDADGTLWAADVVLAFLDRWGPGLPARRSATHEIELARVRSEITPESAVLQLALFAGLTLEQASAQARATFEDQVAPTLYDPISTLLRRFEQAGFETWICSGSPHWLVEPCAEALGIPARRVLATRSIVRQGELTAEPDQVTAGLGKAIAIRDRIGDRLRFAAGDSMSDFEMMLMADRAMVIAHGDDDGRRGALSEHARQRHWWIQSA